ncbi:hypothetical protein FXN63_22480 [Pigmentiphaga aceris]|uniref:Uncharacterized protein n=1 Tax=Pigmentiphaga aceris TaxID=1940612 RepID=A0A5C0B0Y8_9BURK|nr:hypothetical protein [Pigmentiphaga aceris]QEI08288.1 hypothetical protein FXN63_22480 [Pigmentiphaga aceris]
MSTSTHAALVHLMNAFAARHWRDDGLTEARATLRVDGDTLSCTVGEDTFVGHATAPLWFVTGAWTLIYAHECAGRFGHRVAGRVNRVWPNGVGRSRVDHDINDAVLALAAHWPGRLFSASLYDSVATTGQPRKPRVMDDAPDRTTLTGALKRAAAGAVDPDPAQRLKVAEFLEHNLRTEWRFTGEDAMMKAVRPALAALIQDGEPATRELAWLALETCAEACWQNRAYGVFEPICQQLIDLGSNAHLHYARLAESAYAQGDIDGGDAHWATAITGQSPHQAIQLSAAFDHIGDWHDLHTRILRQAGGAHLAWAAGLDPNPARQEKKTKRGVQAPDAATVERHLHWADVLLQRAADSAQARLDIDLPALRAGTTITLGGGQFNPAERRLFLPEIFALQARLAMLRSDETARWRAVFKAIDVSWQLAGSPAHWPDDEDEVVSSTAARFDDETLAAMGMPDCLAPKVAAWRAAQAEGSDGAKQEQLFWRKFLRKVRAAFFANFDEGGTALPGDNLHDAFTVTRDGGAIHISHPLLATPQTGSLAAPLLPALRAWQGLLTATHGHGVLAYVYDDCVALDTIDVAMLADLAAQTLAAGAREEAVALYRFAHGSDPFIRPWPYRNPVPPLPLESVPADLQAAVTRRSALADDAELPRLKPRGRRIAQLAAHYQPDDAVSARFIGHMLLNAAGQAGDSEIERALKAGQPLLMALWQHPDPQVQESAILPIVLLLRMHKLYAPGLDASALQAVARESGIAYLAGIMADEVQP